MKVSEKKRLDLICAAKKEFVTHGYHAANMDRVCEEAGTSKRTLYRHFACKETLFLAAINDIFDGQQGKVTLEYCSSTPLECQLKCYFIKKSSVLYDDIGLPLVRMIIGEFIRQPELAQKYMQLVQNKDLSLQAWVENAIKDGRLDDQGSESMSGMLMNMYHGSFLWPQIVANAAILPPEQQSQTLDKILQVFVRGFSASA